MPAALARRYVRRDIAWIAVCRTAVCGATAMRIGVLIATAICAVVLAAIGGVIWLRPQPQLELLSACAEREQCGYIDTEGRTVIEPVYEAAGDWVRDVGRVWRNNLVGSIDRNGRIVTPTRYAGLNFNAGGGYSVPVG